MKEGWKFGVQPGFFIRMIFFVSSNDHCIFAAFLKKGQ